MHRLSFIILLILSIAQSYAQDYPHGDAFTKDCADCHTDKGWNILLKPLLFDHDSTNFSLLGQHTETNCKSCHKTLVFENTSKECFSCHTDMHQTSLGSDCDRCHDSRSWIIENHQELHLQTRFPLLGAHINADCSSCHPSASLLQFEPLGIDCYDCHKTDYQATTKPNHIEGGYSVTCIECHGASSGSWGEADFEHGMFPLVGGHTISCTDCHTPGDYSNLSRECISCHEDDYNAANIINHQQLNLSNDCEYCHSTDPDWRPASFDDHDSRFFPVYSGKHRGEWNKCVDCHRQAESYSTFTCIDCHEHNRSSMDSEHDEEAGYQYNSPACFECHPRGDKEGAFSHEQTNFPLTGSHSETDCSLCHLNGYAGTSSLCIECHQANYDEARNPGHSEAGIGTACEDCHTAVDWVPSEFDHNTTNFLLTGGHGRAQQCSDCHQGTLLAAVNECFSCHEAQYNDAPEHLTSAFPKTCEECHNNENWEDATFDHDLTNFPLLGVHIETECALCHTTGTYAGTPGLCIDCHQANYTGAQNPSHSAAGIPTSCDDCHTPVGWIPSDFDHSSTGFLLTGGHGRVQQCSDCHKGTLVAAVNECFSCHEAQYNGAPEHLTSNFPRNCEMCHNNDDWEDANFDHNQTNFPLVGVHIETECALCHTSGTYAGTPGLCIDCHQANYTGAQNPSHSAAGIPTSCDDCHTPVGWIPSDFDHSSTGFLLTGGHGRVQQCSDCHKGTLVAAVSECFTCHEIKYNSAPEHLSSNFPKNCEMCHNNDHWDEVTFDHNQTNFQLVGQHISTDCALCHTSGYAGTPSLCIDCHQANYTGAQNPSHSAAGIPTTCDDCHTPVNWKPSDFDHNSTGFFLTGGHGRASQCSDCHQGTLVAAVSECFTCHEIKYNSAPEHLSSNFPKNCEMCHNNDHWDEVTFDHNQTNFQLEGQHISTDCALCHTSGYAGTPSLCIDCHQANYTGAQNPSHSAAGIPTSCDDCHTPVGWIPSDFDHSSTGFVLNGGHASVAQCSDCHQGTLVAASGECYSCHSSDYNNTRNPNHATAFFPTTCEDCHTVNQWDPSTFDHDGMYFPIYSGKHQQEWSTCVDCHTVASNYALFSCIDCHEHNKSDTDNDHSQVRDYQYTSIACFDCHPHGD